MFYTYVIQGIKDNQLYTGFSTDLQKRFKEHNDGEVTAAKDRAPEKGITLVIESEFLYSRPDGRSTKRRCRLAIAPLKNADFRREDIDCEDGVREEIRKWIIFLCILCVSALSPAAQAQDYHSPLNKLSGRHPHDMIRPEQIKDFRKEFPKKHSNFIKRFKNLEKEFDKELMPEPKATRSRQEFISTMNSIRKFCGCMLQFAQAYLDTGDLRYGNQAKRILLHIAKWGPNAGGGFSACDEVPMSIMELCPRVYDWTYDLLSEEEKKQVLSSLRTRGELMYKRVGSGRSLPQDSHGGRMLGFMGEAGIVFYGEIPEAKQWLTGIISVMTRHYPKWGGNDGGWSEGPNYWSWYMRYMIPFLTSLETAVGTNPLLEKSFFKNTIYYGIYCSPIPLRHTPFGDGADYRLIYPGAGVAHTKSFIASFYAQWYRNSYFLWYSKQHKRSKTFDEILLEQRADPEPLEVSPPQDLSQSRYFADIGWVAMHSALDKSEEDIFFLFRSSPYGSVSHSHANANAFALFSKSEPLAIASGYYDHYNSPHHRNWTRQSKASNCILVNSQGQPERGGKAKIEEFSTDGSGDGITYASGNALGAYQGKLTRSLRHCLKLNGSTYILIDDLEAPAPSSYSWLIHSLDKMDVTAKGSQADITIKQGKAQCNTRVFSSVPVKAGQHNGFSHAPVKIKGSKDRQFTTDRPNQWHTTVTTKEKAGSCIFVSRLFVPEGESKVPQFTNEAIDITPAHAAVSWKHKNETLFLLLKRGEAPAAYKDMKSDGLLSCIVCEKENPVRYIFINGTHLTWKGKALIKADAPATVSAALSSSGYITIGLGNGKKDTPITVNIPALVAGPAQFRQAGKNEWTDIKTQIKKPALTFSHPGTRGQLRIKAR